MGARSLPLVAHADAPPAPELPPRPEGWGEGHPVTLRDGHGRALTYLRASILDRCTMACVYCMPPGGEDDLAPRPDMLSFAELTTLVRALGRGGVRRVRLTGGEPLARRDVVGLVAMLAACPGPLELAMTTNGARLAPLAGPLRDAGLTSVNVSLDSLDPGRFARITRGGVLGEVLRGLHAALDAGLDVKLNTVVLGGQNVDELGAITDFAWSLGIVPRFIELMPVGEAASLPAATFVPAARMVEALEGRVTGGWAPSDGIRGPARYLEASDGSGRKVGLITAVSGTFCEGCNRLRLTSRGALRSCLASRRALSLRDLVRAGAGEADLLWAAAVAVGHKEVGHRFLDEGHLEHARVGMSLIGG